MAGRDSRLTTLERPVAADGAALPPFAFRRRGGETILTNDAGRFVRLPDEAFERWLQGRLGQDDPRHAELQAAGFVRGSLDFSALAASLRERSLPLFQPGPSLHMMVVTLRCNQKCQYCHSSAVDPGRTDTDMDVETARRAVDFIFSTPNPTICIEFQGGEPLLNWPVVKFVVRYARLKAKKLRRRLILALVTNFSLLTDDKLEFIEENFVSLCTSLDGPADVHDTNRPFLGGGPAFERVTEAMRRVRARCEAAAPERRAYLPSALMTTTRFSLERHKEIVDLYVSLGLDQIFVRPLSPIGYAKRVWDKIGYTPEQFIEFYDRCLSYILELNRRGVVIAERRALILLTKLLRGQDPGYMDLRSPAGAVLGCLAYNYDGGIYASDEGRMVGHEGDDRFRVGEVSRDRWTDVLDHPTTRACAVASTLEGQPMCFQCAYRPYCGVEPVYHYEAQRSVWGQIPSSGWCRGHMGVFDVIFDKLRDPADRAVFEAWLERDKCRWQEGGEAEEGVPIADPTRP